MGVNAAMIKKQTSISDYLSNCDYTDDPYAHLAAAIIIRAFLDLQEMDGSPKALIEGRIVQKDDLLEFFCSDWCNTLLGFQESVSQNDLVQAVLALDY